MISSKKTTQIQAALNSIEKKDLYSMLLFALYKMKDIPEYLPLAELCYILDGESLLRFLSYYGGMTLTIPTMRDLRLALQALKLYYQVNIDEEDNGNFEDSLNMLAGEEFTKTEIKEMYMKMSEVISKYEFNR